MLNDKFYQKRGSSFDRNWDNFENELEINDLSLEYKIKIFIFCIIYI